MHAPAAGRALAELILDRRYGTLDLTRFGYARVRENAPYREQGVVRPGVRPRRPGPRNSEKTAP